MSVTVTSPSLACLVSANISIVSFRSPPLTSYRVLRDLNQRAYERWTFPTVLAGWAFQCNVPSCLHNFSAIDACLILIFAHVCARSQEASSRASVSNALPSVSSFKFYRPIFFVCRLWRSPFVTSPAGKEVN